MFFDSDEDLRVKNWDNWTEKWDAMDNRMFAKVEIPKSEWKKKDFLKLQEVIDNKEIRDIGGFQAEKMILKNYTAEVEKIYDMEHLSYDQIRLELDIAKLQRWMPSPNDEDTTRIVIFTNLDRNNLTNRQIQHAWVFHMFRPDNIKEILSDAYDYLTSLNNWITQTKKYHTPLPEKPKIGDPVIFSHNSQHPMSYSRGIVQSYDYSRKTVTIKALDTGKKYALKFSEVYYLKDFMPTDRLVSLPALAQEIVCVEFPCYDKPVFFEIASEVDSVNKSMYVFNDSAIMKYSVEEQLGIGAKMSRLVAFIAEPLENGYFNLLEVV